MNLAGLSKLKTPLVPPRQRTEVPTTIEIFNKVYTLANFYPSVPPTGHALQDRDALLPALQLALDRGADNDAELLSTMFAQSVPSSSKRVSAESVEEYLKLFRALFERPTETSAGLICDVLEYLPAEVFDESTRLATARLAMREPRVWAPVLAKMIPLPPLLWRSPLIHRACQALLRSEVPRSTVAHFFVEQVHRDIAAASRWPPEVWADFIQQVDYETSVLILGAFKAVVTVRKEHALTQKEKRRLVKAGTMTPAPPAWTVKQISAPYELALHKWVNARVTNTSSRRTRIGSEVPRTLARDLIDLLGQSGHLPVSFLNGWMNAERVAGNYTFAEMLWQFFDLSLQPTPHALSSPQHADPNDTPSFDQQPQPTAATWAIYFKLRKCLDTAPSIRTDLGNMLELLPQTQRSTQTLNSALSSILQGHKSRPDLPLIIYLLRLYDSDPRGWFGPSPDARTINLAVSALIRLWRMTGELLDQEFSWNLAQEAREKRKAFKQYAVAGDLHEAEWAMVSVALRELISETDMAEVLDNAPAAQLVPLSAISGPEHRITTLRREANLARVYPSDAPMPGSPAALEPKPRAKSSASIRTETEQEREGRPTDRNDPVDFDRSSTNPPPRTPAHVLLRPVIHLIEQALRLCIASRFKRGYTDREIQSAFDKSMEVVYDDLIKPPVGAWVRDERSPEGKWKPVR